MEFERANKYRDRYYICSIIKNGGAIVGFRLYDRKMDKLVIKKTDSTISLLNKYPETIRGLGIRGEDIGLTLIPYSEYTVIDRNSFILKTGNNMLLERNDYDKYIIIDNVGNIIEAGLDKIRKWVNKENICNKDKERIFKYIQNDIKYTDTMMHKLKKQVNMLNVLGNNCLDVERVSINGEQENELIDLKECREENGRVIVGAGISKINLVLVRRKDIKILDMLNAVDCKCIDLQITEGDIEEIIFPKTKDARISLSLHSTSNIKSVKNINRHSIRRAEFDSVCGLEDIELAVCDITTQIKINGANDIKKIRIYSKENSDKECLSLRISNLKQLEILDISELVMNSLENKRFNYLPLIKEITINMNNGVSLYSNFNNCFSLKTVQLVGSYKKFNCLHSDSMERLILNCTFINKPDNILYNVFATQLKEVINNSNITSSELIDEEYFTFLEKFKDNEDVMNMSKIFMLKYNVSDNSLELGRVKECILNGDTKLERDIINNRMLRIPKEINKITDIGLSNAWILRNTNRVSIETIEFNGDIEIGDGVLACSEVSELKNSEYITKLGKYAFKNCERIKVFSCGNKLEIIEEGAFLGCAELETINVTPNLKKIEKYGLFLCNLKHIYGTAKFECDNLGIFNGKYINKLDSKELLELSEKIGEVNRKLDKFDIKFTGIDFLNQLYKDIQGTYLKNRIVNEYGMDTFLKIMTSVEDADRLKKGELSKIKRRRPKELQNKDYSVMLAYLMIVLNKDGKNIQKKLDVLN